MPIPPPPGRLVDLGTHRLHVQCEGDGSPTVVCDSALGASSLSWSLVRPGVARVTRICTYDRAGFGWSEMGPGPRTAGRIASELAQLLERAAIPPPYLLVGHSFGGLVMRLLAMRHPDRVAGLLLIEPAIPEEWIEPTEARRAMIARGTQLCRYGATAARLGLAHVVSTLVRSRALGPARAAVKLISRGGLSREDEGILAPIWRLPPESRALLGRMWSQPKFFDALGSQIAHIGDSAAEVAAEAASVPADMPLIVLSSAQASDERLEADRALARRHANGRHVLVPDTGHWIPLDAPHAVTEVIRDLVIDHRAR